jgi:hypothetical protein
VLRGRNGHLQTPLLGAGKNIGRGGERERAGRGGSVYKVYHEKVALKEESFIEDRH